MHLRIESTRAIPAQVVELADAQDSGACARKDLLVRVQSRAPYEKGLPQGKPLSFPQVINGVSSARNPIPSPLESLFSHVVRDLFS
jgi:hypothetical protein